MRGGGGEGGRGHAFRDGNHETPLALAMVVVNTGMCLLDFY